MKAVNSPPQSNPEDLPSVKDSMVCTPLPLASLPPPASPVHFLWLIVGNPRRWQYSAASLRVTSFIGFRRVIGLTAAGAGAEAGVEFGAGTSDVVEAGSEAVSVSGAGSGVAAASSRGRAQPRPRAVPEMTR